MKSAIRRYHYKRLQKGRKIYWFGPWDDSTKEKIRLGKLANTSHPCSCQGGCGHMREAVGLTRQELRAPKVEDWYEDNTKH